MMIINAGAYPNTGSFSRTAIKARSGVRTPLAGVFSAIVVLLCLYALTPAFYYIPDAILSAVIIHAVSDLVSGPKFVQHLWHINPLELFTFIAAIIVTFFTSVEYGIYVSVGLSIFIMLIRIARPRYAVLGRVAIQPLNQKDSDEETYVYVRENHPTLHDVVEPPPPGVLIFRFDESLTYPNSSFISDKIMHYVQDHFTTGAPPPTTKGERAWNDPSPLVKKEDLENVIAEREASGRRLRAIVLDFSAVNHLDSTGVQTLLDLRLAINRYCGSEIEWHFASIATPFIRNSLIIAGFGKQNGRESHPFELVPVVPSHSKDHNTQHIDDDGTNPSIATNEVVSTNNNNNNNTTANIEKQSMYYSIKQASLDSISMRSTPTASGQDLGDEEASIASSNNMEKPTSGIINISKNGDVSYYPLLQRGVPLDRYPFFHWDLEDAVRAATYASLKE